MSLRYGLTRRQRDCLEFLREYSTEHGIMPSYDEMKKALGLASKSGIHRIICALEERGFITRFHDRARAIEIVEEANIAEAQIALRVAWRQASRTERFDFLRMIGANPEGARILAQ